MADGNEANFNIVVCASGGGGNFQALIDASDQGRKYTITKLIADRECGAVARALSHKIQADLIDKKSLGSEGFWARFSEAIPENADLIVLAGFMPIVPAHICAAWNGRIINTHPSLLPKYGGKGMVGVKVQEALLAAGDKTAGCTVHFVTPVIDGGAILAQAEIAVLEGESAWDLGGRVFREENRILVDAVLQLKERAKKNGAVD